MQVVLHQGQIEVANDPHRFRIICAGRRWGKSVLGRLILLQQACKEPGIYWLVSPTYRQGKQNHWRDLLREVPRSWVVKKNEVDLSLTLANGSIIELKGAENPDSLRGVKLRGLVIDEIASIRNWPWLWQEVLRPTLTDYEAPALFISTPKGFNHFYDLYEQGQSDSPLYKSWRFSSYDNPYIPKGEIDAAKTDLTEDTFYQEYMADFRKHTGAAHPDWDHELHYIAPFDVPREWQYGRGFDYGTAHYTGSTRIAIDPDDNWYLDISYLDNRRDIEGHAQAIRSQDYGLGFVPSWGDPSGAQWFIEFAKYDLHIQPAVKTVSQANKGWVEFGVEKVNERLKRIPGHTIKLPDGRTIDDAPRLFVFKRPENEPFVKQIENLEWRSTAVGTIVPVLDETNDPTGGHFDLMAAIRYFAVSWAPVKKKTEAPWDAEHRPWGYSSIDAYR